MKSLLIIAFLCSAPGFIFSQVRKGSDDVMDMYITPYKFDKRFADVPVDIQIHPKHYLTGKTLELFNVQRIEVKKGIFHGMTINDRIRLGVFKLNNSMPALNSLKSKD